MYQKGITFVIPAYNTEHTISRTLESILRQTDQHYEVIIVNDGSSDHTEDICKKYAEEYPDKIRYIYQENRGLGGARNHGMRLAGREYVAFLDSDDWLMPEYVETVMAQLRWQAPVHPEIILILPQIYDENSKKVCEWYDAALFRELFREDGQIINPQNNEKILLSDVNQCRKILQTDFINRIRFQFREQVKWEDVYPHFFLLSQCRSCMGIKSTGFYYRKGSSQQITASRGADRMDLLIVYQDLVDYMTNPALPGATAVSLVFPAMRILISFSMEGIRMADTDIRPELVQRLSAFFCTIPDRWYREWKKGSRKYGTKKERIRQCLFQTAVRRRWLSRWFCDYLYQEAAEHFIKRIFHIVRRKKDIHGTV